LIPVTWNRRQLPAAAAAAAANVDPNDPNPVRDAKVGLSPPNLPPNYVLHLFHLFRYIFVTLSPFDMMRKLLLDMAKFRMFSKTNKFTHGSHNYNNDNTDLPAAIAAAPTQTMTIMMVMTNLVTIPTDEKSRPRSFDTSS
jgi:hypothetical protein